MPNPALIKINRPRPTCLLCSELVAIRGEKSKLGFPKYFKHCNMHNRRNHRRYLKEACELCGFKPVHRCQLDVDHKDCNNKNNDPSNLQTLCANCHRLKTHLAKDWLKKSLKD